jgi:hypothetical protein
METAMKDPAHAMGKLVDLYKIDLSKDFLRKCREDIPVLIIAYIYKRKAGRLENHLRMRGL